MFVMDTNCLAACFALMAANNHPCSCCCCSFKCQKPAPFWPATNVILPATTTTHLLLIRCLHAIKSFVLLHAQSRSSAKKGKRPSSGGACAPLLHHFVRLRPPRSSRQHPLAGLWKGLYGPHGLEILSISYDFSLSSARIVCTKVTGKAGVLQHAVVRVTTLCCIGCLCVFDCCHVCVCRFVGLGHAVVSTNAWWLTCVLHKHMHASCEMLLHLAAACYILLHVALLSDRYCSTRHRCPNTHLSRHAQTPNLQPSPCHHCAGLMPWDLLHPTLLPAWFMHHCCSSVLVLSFHAQVTPMCLLVKTPGLLQPHPYLSPGLNVSHGS